MPKGLQGFQKGHSRLNSGKSDFKHGEKHPFWKGGVSKKAGYMKEYLKKYTKKKLEEKAGRLMPDQCEIFGALTSELKYRLSFDHDHNTGRFRGWICTRCNIALGLVKDNIGLLEAMIKYLKSNI